MESYNFPAQRDRDQCSPREDCLKVLTREMRRSFLGELACAQTLEGRRNSDGLRRQSEWQDPRGSKAWWKFKGNECRES